MPARPSGNERIPLERDTEKSALQYGSVSSKSLLGTRNNRSRGKSVAEKLTELVHPNSGSDEGLFRRKPKGFEMLSSQDHQLMRWTEGFPLQKMVWKCVLATAALILILVLATYLAIMLYQGQGLRIWTTLRDNPDALRQNSGSLQSSSGFNEDVAKQILVYAGVAYESDESTFASCTPSFYVHKKLWAVDGGGNSVEGFTGMYNEEFIVVAVQGTTKFLQLAYEWYSLGPENYRGSEDVRVVTYWNRIANQMLNDTVTSLNSLISSCTSCPVYFTGHSLGAATVTILLTTIMHLELVSFPTQPEIYTFGQPRVGNKAFSELSASYYDAYRVVNSRDPVVHIPCCNFKLWGSRRYQCLDLKNRWSPWHNMQEIYYQDMSGGYTECDGEGEDMNCADAVRWYSYSLHDHHYYYNIRVELMCSYLLGYVSDYEFYYQEANVSDDLQHGTINTTTLTRSSCIVF